MGGSCNSKPTKKPEGPPIQEEIEFGHFEILRAIGRGAFGKVCLVERKDTKEVFAMKYVNKQLCLRRDAFKNICAEVELLRSVDHPFVGGLWYTFQDPEDLYMILEPLLGGDLRYHLNGGESSLNEEQVRFVCAEIACALDFLRKRDILHRDVKPDNILLDDQGHAHLTDFNVATRITSKDKLAHTLAGTKPYMAPELIRTAASSRARPGYSFAVDWWSLGVTAYELKMGSYRPYDIHASTSLSGCLSLFERDKVYYPDKWSPEFTKFLQGLLAVSPERRVASLAQLKRQKLMANVNVTSLCQRKLPPPFVPKSEGLNCDPTYELEEMIVEPKPLHEKPRRMKDRLKRQRTLMTQRAATQNVFELAAQDLKEANEEEMFAEFPRYNREWERYQESRDEKERLWEQELKALMEPEVNTGSS